MSGPRSTATQQKVRSIAGYALPCAGTLEGDLRLANDDLSAMSDLDLHDEGMAARHALLHLSRRGDRLLRCYPRPMSVGDWLRARIAAISERLSEVNPGLGFSRAAHVVGSFAGESEPDLSGVAAGGSL